MSTLITGVAGFLGSHLAEQLLDQDSAVTGIDSLTDYYSPDLKRSNLSTCVQRERFNFVEADINDTNLASLLTGVGTVFHLAGQPGVRASWGDSFDTYTDQNILATQRLLEAAKQAQVSRFVFASSSSVYGEAETFPITETSPLKPISPYGVSKLAGEALCQLYFKVHNVPVVVLRYFSIYGPRQRPDMALSRFITAGLSNSALQVLGDGEQSRDFTYVGDAVNATVAAGTQGRPGETYNVAGGSQVTVNEMIAEIERVSNLSLQIDYLPASPGDPRDTVADTSKAQQELSYGPQTSFADGVAKQWQEQMTPVV